MFFPPAKTIQGLGLHLLKALGNKNRGIKRGRHNRNSDLLDQEGIGAGVRSIILDNPYACNNIALRSM